MFLLTEQELGEQACLQRLYLQHSNQKLNRLRGTAGIDLVGIVGVLLEFCLGKNIHFDREFSN